jgi:hypothetical protein
MATKTETKKLTLRRESLRDLNATELQQVVGATGSACGMVTRRNHPTLGCPTPGW